MCEINYNNFIVTRINWIPMETIIFPRGFPYICLQISWIHYWTIQSMSIERVHKKRKLFKIKYHYSIVPWVWQNEKKKKEFQGPKIGKSRHPVSYRSQTIYLLDTHSMAARAPIHQLRSHFVALYWIVKFFFLFSFASILVCVYVYACATVHHNTSLMVSA